MATCMLLFLQLALYRREALPLYSCLCRSKSSTRLITVGTAHKKRKNRQMHIDTVLDTLNAAFSGRHSSVYFQVTRSAWSCCIGSSTMQGDAAQHAEQSKEAAVLVLARVKSSVGLDVLFCIVLVLLLAQQSLQGKAGECIAMPVAAKGCFMFMKLMLSRHGPRQMAMCLGVDLTTSQSASEREGSLQSTVHSWGQWDAW